MADQPGSGRLDADTLAAYLDGRLPPEARAWVEAELAADPEGYEWAVNALRVSDELSREEGGRGGGKADASSPSGGGTGEASRRAGQSDRQSGGGDRVVPFHRRRGMLAIAAATLATAAALVLVVQLQPDWWRQLTGAGSDPRFASLVAAVGEERYIEGRLTGGFEYGPLRPVTRGPGDLAGQNLALLAAAGELQKAAQADPSAENLHAWGVAQVLLGDYDGAIRTLETAQAANPDDVAIASDLAAALIARGDRADDASDWQRARDLAARAVESAAPPPEAWFNRALALERLGRDAEALEAWRRGAASAAGTEWAEEMRRREAALAERLGRDRR